MINIMEAKRKKNFAKNLMDQNNCSSLLFLSRVYQFGTNLILRPWWRKISCNRTIMMLWCSTVKNSFSSASQENILSLFLSQNFYNIFWDKTTMLCYLLHIIKKNYRWLEEFSDSVTCRHMNRIQRKKERTCVWMARLIDRWNSNAHPHPHPTPNKAALSNVSSKAYSP